MVGTLNEYITNCFNSNIFNSVVIYYIQWLMNLAKAHNQFNESNQTIFVEIILFIPVIGYLI